MHSTTLRNDRICGLLLGTAIGDALGSPREGLSRRLALKIFGRPPLRYRLVPGRGVYGDDTQLMLLAGQAILNSRNESKYFCRAFQRRLRWYPFSLPAKLRSVSHSAAVKCWFVRLGVSSGLESAGSGAATRSLLLALAINRNSNRLNRWIEESCRLTHTHSLAINGCQVLAKLVDYGADSAQAEFNPHAALDLAIGTATESEIKEKLVLLKQFLSDQRSPSAVARHFGWDAGINDYIVPVTIMSTYCWLRYADSFEKAVGSAIGLGGRSDLLGAVVGGLAGAHLGVQALPENLCNQLGGAPHDVQWMSALASRFSHWPHGPEDIQSAPGQPSEPILQLIRNVSCWPIVATHNVFRFPYRLLSPSLPRRDRVTMSR